MYDLQKGDVLFIRSSVKREGVGETSLVLKDIPNTVYSGFLIRYRNDEKIFNDLFKKYCFWTTSFRRLLLSYSTTSANTNINQESLNKLTLYCPNYNEQRKIAEFLTAIDTRLQSLEKKKSLLKQYKKGVMQHIFNQEIRFKDEDGKEFPEWEKKRLGDLALIITGKTPKTSDPKLWGGDIQFITPTDINDENKYQKGSSRSVVKNKSIKILPVGSILYTCIASIGKMAITTKLAISNQQINAVAVNTDNLNEFIYYYLLYLTPKIKSTQANTTLPIINKTEFSKTKIFTPILKEQTKIANFLSAIDKRIDLVAKQIEKTKSYKIGLLQQLFV